MSGDTFQGTLHVSHSSFPPLVTCHVSPVTLLADDIVLVALLKHPRDLEFIHHERWYRVPQRSAPKHFAGAQYLAFYLTSAFREHKWSIREFAQVRGHELVRRRDLLPDESNHPRADEPYYKLQLGQTQMLEQPIVSKRGRRALFVWTTGAKFMNAREINDLLGRSPTDDALWERIKAEGLDAERQMIVKDGRARYRVDFLIYCPNGKIAVWLGEAVALKNRRAFRVLAFDESEDLHDVITVIRREVHELAGLYRVKNTGKRLGASR